MYKLRPTAVVPQRRDAQTVDGEAQPITPTRETRVNKSELIDAVAEAADISKAAASRAVDGMVDSITKALRDNDQVTLVGFGTFSVRQREARAGRNPQTGAAIEIKAAKIPTFKAGKGLKDALQ